MTRHKQDELIIKTLPEITHMKVTIEYLGADESVARSVAYYELFEGGMLNIPLSDPRIAFCNT